LDVAERSVMVAGPATALLGVSSLDLAPPAATGGVIFRRVRAEALGGRTLVMSFPRIRSRVYPRSAL
jgi:hypothetical protein